MCVVLDIHKCCLCALYVFFCGEHVWCMYTRDIHMCRALYFYVNRIDLVDQVVYIMCFAYVVYVVWCSENYNLVLARFVCFVYWQSSRCEVYVIHCTSCRCCTNMTAE